VLQRLCDRKYLGRLKVHVFVLHFAALVTLFSDGFLWVCGRTPGPAKQEVWRFSGARILQSSL
jgi:hypothetical protein